MIQPLATTFAALGDPVRLEIVERLLALGEMNAGALQEGFAISPPAVSRHLKVLRQAGLIVRRVDAQRRFYSVRPEAVQAIGKWAFDYRAFWESSLDRLEMALAQEGEA